MKQELIEEIKELIKINPNDSIEINPKYLEYFEEEELLDIKKQLEFILNQTLPIDEIIICDDRSQDNTIQLIKELKIRQKIILSVMNVHLLIVFQLIER